MKFEQRFISPYNLGEITRFLSKNNIYKYANYKCLNIYFSDKKTYRNINRNDCPLRFKGYETEINGKKINFCNLQITKGQFETKLFNRKTLEIIKTQIKLDFTLFPSIGSSSYIPISMVSYDRIRFKNNNGQDITFDTNNMFYEFDLENRVIDFVLLCSYNFVEIKGTLKSDLLQLKPVKSKYELSIDAIENNLYF